MNQAIGFSLPLSEVVERLGWVLVHSLWQLLILAGLAAVAVRVLRRRSAVARYRVLLLALAAVVAAPFVTWNALPPSEAVPMAAGVTDQSLSATDVTPSDATVRIQQPNAVNLGTAETARTPALSVGAPSNVPFEASRTFSQRPARPAWFEWTATSVRPWLPVLVLSWLIGVIVCSLRPLLGWRTLHRLQHVGVSPVSEDILAALRRVSARLGARCAVRVLQSTLAQVPVVVGYLRPVILLPATLATSIPSDQLEAILAHELAHVMRHDFLWNLLQTLVETLFFYHPAVWWLSHRMRVERENCCDDCVVASLGNRIAYGRALLAVEELRGQAALLALGATDGSMLSRLRRILGTDPASSQATAVRQNRRWPVTLICLTSVILAVAMSADWNPKANAELIKQTKHSVSPFVAKLPDGLSVELLGVAEMSNAPSAWWQPDGSTLEQALPHHAGALKPAVAEERRAVVRVHGVKDTRDVIANYSGVRMDFARKSDNNGVLCDVRTFPLPGKTSGRIELGIATEPLSRTRYVEFQKKAPQPIDKSVDPIAEDLAGAVVNSVKFSNPKNAQESEGGVSLTFTVPVSGMRQIDLELKCIDLDGKAHDAMQISTNGPTAARQELTYLFNVPEKKAAWFEYRMRVFRHWVTFDNVSLHANQNTSVKVTVHSPATSDAEAIAGQVAISMARLQLPFLDQAKIQDLRLELYDAISQRSRAPLSEAQRARLIESLVNYIHREFTPPTDNAVYLDFSDRFATLRWALESAVIRGELAATDVARRETQRQWMRAEITKLPLPEKFAKSHQPQLDELQSLFDDELNPFTQEPMSDAEFQQFQAAFEKRTAHIRMDRKLMFANSYLLQSAFDVLHDRLVPKEALWSRANVRFWLKVTREVGLSAMHLQTVNARSREDYADVMRSMIVPNEPPADVAARPAWRQANADGDLAYDAKVNSLIAVRGARLALLKAGSWFAADQVPTEDLRTLIDTTGSPAIPLFDFAEPSSGPIPAPVSKVRSAAPFVVVQTKAGGISVVQVKSVFPDSVVIKCRPRLAETGKGGQPANAQPEQGKANVQPDDATKMRQQVDAIADQFVTSMKTLNLPYIDGEILKAMHRELRDELVNQVPRPVSEEWLKQVLSGVDMFCQHAHHRRFRHQERCMEDFEMLKWHLWTAMDRDELTPEELTRRESQRQWFRDYAKSLPNPDGDKVGRWQFRDGTIVESTTLAYKLGELEDVISDPLNPYFAWPLNDDDFAKVQSEVKVPTWIVSRKPTLGGIAGLVGHPMVDVHRKRVIARWPIEYSDNVFDMFAACEWRWDRNRAERTLASLKEDQQSLAGDGKNDQPAEKKTFAPLFTLPQDLTISAVGFRTNDEDLVSVSTQDWLTVQHWDLRQKRLRNQVELETKRRGTDYRTLVLSADGQRVAAIRLREISIWDTSTGKLLGDLPSPFDRPRSPQHILACTPDMSYLASVFWETGDPAVKNVSVVWDTRTNQIQPTIQHPIQRSLLQNIALSADGKRLATAGMNGAIRVWEVATGNQQLEALNANLGMKYPDSQKLSDDLVHQISVLSFSPDGKQLAYGDMVGINLIDALTGKMLHQIREPSLSTQGQLVFSQDSQLIARLARHNVVSVWDTTSGKPVNKLMVKMIAGAFGAFSHDGKLFATGSPGDKGIGVWKVRPDQP